MSNFAGDQLNQQHNLRNYGEKIYSKRRRAVVVVKVTCWAHISSIIPLQYRICCCAFVNPFVCSTAHRAKWKYWLSTATHLARIVTVFCSKLGGPICKRMFALSRPIVLCFVPIQLSPNIAHSQNSFDPVKAITLRRDMGFDDMIFARFQSDVDEREERERERQKQMFPDTEPNRFRFNNGWKPREEEKKSTHEKQKQLSHALTWHSHAEAIGYACANRMHNRHGATAPFRRWTAEMEYVEYQ